ncbi:MAG TPA: SpoIIE family protein phosphatase [Acidimicrobiales bacterium]|nr:SpoIIE family protein phosphatase [Acidimicrobiales bacterium]
MAAELLERERLAALQRYDVVEAPVDGTFDRITALAARLLRVPIAIVSIVDQDRIWFRSHHGIDVPDIPRSPGLCASAILQTEPYVLPDARLDPVALANPLVAGEFGLRFYAAIPLTMADGHNLGTLCVIDKQPRTLTDEELATLTDLALLVVHELELRLAARMAVGFETELRRSSEELSEALQAALLPPHLPRIPGLDVAAHYQPAARERIGGDFYDLFPLPRKGWGIAMGDVCGKGPRAATITAAARYALRAAAVDHDAPSDVLSVLNETLLIDDGHDDTRFCTLIYARLRPHGRDFSVTVGSGGHPLPLVLRDEDGTVHPVGDYGTLVGTLPAVSFHNRTVRLRAGDTLVLYTDGVTEAMVQGRQLGRDGLAGILASCSGLSAAETVKAVAEAVLDGSHQRDDIAILALQPHRN